MKSYQKPAILVIEIDAQGIIAQSSPRIYNSMSVMTSDNADVQVSYGGINTNCFEGGFLDSK